MLTRVRSDDDWALLAPLWPEKNSTVKTETIARHKSVLKFTADYVQEMQRIRAMEKSTLDKFLVRKLATDEYRSSQSLKLILSCSLRLINQIRYSIYTIEIMFCIANGYGYDVSCFSTTKYVCVRSQVF